MNQLHNFWQFKLLFMNNSLKQWTRGLWHYAR